MLPVLLFSYFHMSMPENTALKNNNTVYCRNYFVCLTGYITGKLTIIHKKKKKNQVFVFNLFTFLLMASLSWHLIQRVNSHKLNTVTTEKTLSLTPPSFPHFNAHFSTAWTKAKWNKVVQCLKVSFNEGTECFFRGTDIQQDLKNTKENLLFLSLLRLPLVQHIRF